MRILHTSDWHLGRTFYGYKFSNAFDKFIDWLIKQIYEQKIDILIIAGDVFDKYLPSNNTLKQYYSILLKLHKTGLKKIIIIAGNHDNPATLKAPKDILQLIDIHIVENIYFTNEERKNIDTQKHIIKIPQQNPKLIVCAVPYPRERELKALMKNKDYKSREQELKDKIKLIYSQLYNQIIKFKQQNIPVIATGHLFIKKDYSKNKQYDYDDENYIGGLTDIASQNLNMNFDYWALGHIHKPFKIIENKMHYSGSPLPYGIPEAPYKKKIFIIDTNNNIDVQEIIIPKFVNLIHLEGSFSQIKTKLQQLNTQKNSDNVLYLTFIEKQKTIHQKIIENLIEQTQKQQPSLFIAGYKYISENIDFQFFIDNTQDTEQLSPRKLFLRILEENNANTEPYISMFNQIYNSVMNNENN